MHRLRKHPALRKGLLIFQDYLLITVGAVLLAVNVNMFLAPNQVISTGITGLGMLANYLWGWPIGLVTLLLNLPLLLAGVRWGGGLRFFLGTIYAVLVMTLMIDWLAPFIPPILGDPLIYTLFGGLLDGIGIGLVVRSRATTGGTDIVAQLLNRYRGMPFGQVFMVVNSIILMAGAIVVGLVPVLYALIVNFVSARVVDMVQEGVRYARTVFIVSNKNEQIRQRIFQELHRGITIFDARGGYTATPRPALYVVISRPELTTLKRLVADIDPQAFIVVSEAQEVLGEGFKPVQELAT